MGMKLLKARELPLKLHFKVLLDDTKLDAEGEPLPEWVVEYDLLKDRQPGESKNAWVARVKGDVKQMAQAELASRLASEEQVLPGEGQPF